MTTNSGDEASTDPVLEAFARAPVGEPLTPEERAELDQIMAAIADGTMPLVPHAEVHAWIMQKNAEEIELAAE